jgi:quercetin dioxygenase-like cupin family protein
MKAWKAVSMIALVLVWSGVALAQDPVKVDAAHYKVLLDNASVRVLQIGYAAGSKSVMHQHPDAIVVTMAAGKVRFTMPDGKTEDQDMAVDSAQYSAAGTHNPANVGTTKLEALLVEFKGAAAGKAALPASRPGLTLKMLAEGARATAYRATAATTFAEPAGSTHDFDQVVISLAATQMSLAIAGRPAKTTWARGDVQFIGRGVAHEAKNTSGKPIDFVIVAIK